MDLIFNNKSCPSLKKSIEIVKENLSGLYCKRMEFTHSMDSVRQVS